MRHHSPLRLSLTLTTAAFGGSPQEQKITLKNDGPVAATVNLGQVSAPFAFKNAGGVYSSAALELAGGQTREVWVQFNPTASGNFSGSTALSLSGACVKWSEVLDGRGQCLEQSVALAGVAHKIKIEPEELDFYTVLVGSLHEERVTITNTGTTSVTLAIERLELPYRVSPPYRTLAENPFTLAPNQSQEFIVEFNPLAVGAYAQSMRLHSNKAILEVPMQGAAQTQEWFDQQRQAYLNALLQTYHASCDTGLERGSVLGSPLFVPRSSDSSIVLLGLCSLTPEQLQELLAWGEGSEPLLDQIIPTPPSWWDPQEALQGLHTALEEYRNTGFSTAALYGIIKQLITPTEAAYNRHFEWFYLQMLSSSLNDLIAVTGTLVTILSPWLSPVTSTLLGLILPVLQQPLGPGLNATDRFLAALVIAMNQHPQIANAMGGLLQIQKQRPFYLVHAVGAIITIAALTQVNDFSRQGLNSNFYNMFLGRLEQLAQFPELSRTYISTFFRTLTSHELSRIPEEYTNMIAGFILYIDVAKNLRSRGGIVNLVPAAAYWLPSRIVGDPSFGNLPASVARFVHLIATFNIEGFRGRTQRITIFAHAQAKLLNDDVDAVVHNVLNTIEQGANWMINIGHRYGVDGTPVIVVIAYDAEENAVEHLRWKLYNAFRSGWYSWPVVIITKDENGNVKAICVCLRMSPEQAQEFANAIASAMGYEPGKPFPTTGPEGEIPPLRPFFGYTNKQIRDAAFECQWWEADPTDPNSFWECMLRKLPPKPHQPR